MTTNFAPEITLDLPPTSEYLPGGYTRSALVVGSRSPQIVSGSGPWVTDQSGRRLIDMNNDFSALIHGNSHPDVTEESIAALRDGAAFGAPTRWEDHHAGRLLSRLETCDRVRYTTSGTEAVMTAVRLARDYTGREKLVVVKNAYHGFSDSVIGAGGQNAQRGVPRGLLDHLILVGIDDVEALEEAFADRAEDIAAVLVDLMPNRAGLLEPSDRFLAACRQLCDEHGAVLIDDEVINFRDGYNGIAANRGLKPDLVVLGKMIGGGQPIGAVAGRGEIMERFDPFAPGGGLEQGGTFAATPQALRAGAKSLDLFDETEAARLNALGDLARERLRQAIEPLGWTVRGRGSLLRPFPGPGRSAKPSADQLRLYWTAYEAGVLIMPTALLALSTPMTEEVVIDAIDKVSEAVARVAAEGAGYENER